MTEWGAIGRNGYSQLADVYHRSRPSCPVDLVDRIARHAGVRAGDPVAEIGAGTGLFTRLLAGRGLAITALEPVAEMRARAHPFPDVKWSDGTFERTGLPDASQQWVVSCQAFQWADQDAALPELRRILRPDAWFTTVWYAHEISRSPVLQRSFRLLRDVIPAYGYVDRTTWARRLASRMLSAMPASAQRAVGRVASLRSTRGGRGAQLQRSGDFGKVAYHEARLPTRVDREGYLDLWRSRNRLRTLGAGGAFDAFLEALAHDLARHGVDDVEVTYVFGAWSAQRRVGPASAR